MEMSKFKLSLF